MSKIGIFYGSTTGTCEDLANRIASAIGDCDVKNVTDFGSASDYDFLILGTSTWGMGDLQDDWYTEVDKLKSLPLQGKKVAVFGCGDSDSYCDSFCSAMKELYDAAVSAGAEVVGAVDASDYNFSESSAVVDGKFVGLALDEINEPEKTDDRINAWVKQITA